MPEKKPLIGITASQIPETQGPGTSPGYIDALYDSGALPLILPLTLTAGDCRRLGTELDGFLFTGGPDIHPFYFEEETLEGCGNQSALRDETELLLFSEAFSQRKPILAICRGIQLLNIALGGDIFQDISRQAERTLPIAHRQPFDPSVPSHHVTLDGQSLLASITGPGPLEVNSSHHQAIRRTADGLRVCGWAPDGMIEALEHPDYPFLIGVQWHPELLYHTQSHAKKLFASFVGASLKKAGAPML